MAPVLQESKEKVKSVDETLKTATTESEVLPYTPLDEIPKGVQKLRDSFHKKGKTHSVQYRLNQMRNVYFAIKDNEEAICDALYKDFYREPAETKILEIAPGLAELVHVMGSLYRWSKPEKVTDLNLVQSLSPVYIERVPLGVVLAISPFNYPFLLSLSSIIGALSGGNAVAFKPPESTPHFSKLFCDLLSEALDDDIFFAVNGAIPETTKLLDQKFDKIIYTGSGRVGTIVAKKAAETLTPVLLELGGKSPGFILEDVNDKDLGAIARRIVWGRFVNAGQTCVGVDYVLVPEHLHDKLVTNITNVLKEFFPDISAKNTPGYTHLIHKRAFDGMVKIIKSTKAKIAAGGDYDESTRYVGPTVLTNCQWSDSSMQGEIFGPILPIVKYSNLDSVVDHVVQNYDQPLVQYIFTSGSNSRSKNKQLDYILRRIRSGDVIINDVLMHVALSNAPFGGIGPSGTGAYHGWYSFRLFTHERILMEQSLSSEFLVQSRYPPYNSKKARLTRSAMESYNGKVWFDRTGDVRLKGPNSLWGAWASVAGVFALGYYFVSSL